MENFGKDLLRKIKSVELPGEPAHGVFSPPYRPVLHMMRCLQKIPSLQR